MNDANAPKKTVTLIRGDGIGPEVADAVVYVLEAAGAPLAFEEAVVGRAAEEREGDPLPDKVLESIRRNRVRRTSATPSSISMSAAPTARAATSMPSPASRNRHNRGGATA